MLVNVTLFKAKHLSFELQSFKASKLSGDSGTSVA